MISVLLLDCLRCFFFALFNSLSKCFLTLAQGFRQLRQPGCAKKQKDDENDDYKLRSSKSRDCQHGLTHNSSLSQGAEPAHVRLFSSIRFVEQIFSPGLVCSTKVSHDLPVYVQ